VRLALVALVVLAVVIPTALVPQTATGTVYSGPQVLRAFRTEGIALRRQSQDASQSYESFVGRIGAGHLSVVVFQPYPGRQLVAFGWTGAPPKVSRRGNVDVFWSLPQGSRGGAARIQAALAALPPR
jgi:hypothetical protein